MCMCSGGIRCECDDFAGFAVLGNGIINACDWGSRVFYSGPCC